ncbi:hypothetical protein [Brevibacillus gelatini]
MKTAEVCRMKDAFLFVSHDEAHSESQRLADFPIPFRYRMIQRHVVASCFLTGHRFARVVGRFAVREILPDELWKNKSL